MDFFDIHTHHSATDTAIQSCHTADLPQGWCSLGIHPWYIETDFSQQMERMYGEKLPENVVAIGEIGLDKNIQTPLSVQQSVLQEQIYIAEERALPLVIHCVRAWDELLLAYKKSKKSVPWVIHGFRGKGTLAAQLLRQGFYLSFGTHFQAAAVREAWSEKLFAETDETPPINTVYEQLSASLGLPLAVIAPQIRRNVRDVFGI